MDSLATAPTEKRAMKQGILVIQVLVYTETVLLLGKQYTVYVKLDTKEIRVVKQQKISVRPVRVFMVNVRIQETDFSAFAPKDSVEQPAIK